MTGNNKVSIIVPVYKVEKYIHRCVDSILGQTYSNLEIILVNDGSPDECGRIADQYRKQDERIKVIHKPNGGLSEARNVGMEAITGEFTMFVDSDDWLEKDMVEQLLHHSLHYKADVVQSAFYYAYDDKLLIDDRHYQQGKAAETFDKQSLMYELVRNEKVKNFAWGKLYKTSVVKNIPFEKGVLFEDVFWAHRIMHAANRFVLLHQPLYNYYQRNDSIVATYTPRNLDMLTGLKKQHVFLEKHYPEFTDESLKVLLKTSLLHYNLLFLNRKQDPGRKYREEIRSYIRHHYYQMSAAVKDDKELKQQLHLFIFHPYSNLAFLAARKGLRKLRPASEPVGLKQVSTDVSERIR